MANIGHGKHRAWQTQGTCEALQGKPNIRHGKHRAWQTQGTCEALQGKPNTGHLAEAVRLDVEMRSANDAQILYSRVHGNVEQVASQG
eukprot:scaffold57980_cov16-Tisochrysis_lutea.AAC.2